jgi:hypothetical protein
MHQDSCAELLKEIAAGEVGINKVSFGALGQQFRQQLLMSADLLVGNFAERRGPQFLPSVPDQSNGSRCLPSKIGAKLLGPGLAAKSAVRRVWGKPDSNGFPEAVSSTGSPGRIGFAFQANFGLYLRQGGADRPAKIEVRLQ